MPTRRRLQEATTKTSHTIQLQSSQESEVLIPIPQVIQGPAPQQFQNLLFNSNSNTITKPIQPTSNEYQFSAHLGGGGGRAEYTINSNNETFLQIGSDPPPPIQQQQHRNRAHHTSTGGGGGGEPIENTQLIADDDDKYNKAARPWNFRSLSSRLQSTSGQALRTFIQQPLSAAAAVVTGNHHNTQFPESNNNYSNSNTKQSYLALPQTETSSDHNNSDSESLYEQKENIIVMAARDRTAEFANAIRSLQSRNISRAVNIRDPRKVKQLQSYGEFMSVAKYIGKNIASTYAKLEKLTLLAKKKSLFDDRPQEIQELTYIIKGDLNALNQQIAKLQEISKEQRRNTNGKHLLSHSSNMVLALQSKLASMSTDFKQILEVRTENLKQQKTRRDQFSQGSTMGGVNAVPPNRENQASLLLSEENQAVSIDMSSSDTSPLLGPPARLQQQQTQMMLYDESESYVQQRAETMQNIESTIVELGGIFQQLAHMVKEQEETVERIDTNIYDAEINIEAAHGEIMRYFRSVSRNRWLMLKIFGVLIFFFVFFVVFLT